jgi:UDP-N-acetylglucosamine transferase subunit ALG13
MDARKLGRVPIVLPRNADLGEHVDNHQQRFARKMAELGEIHLVQTQDEMFELVEKAIADPTAFATSTDGAAIAAAVAKFEELVDGLFDRKRARR